MTTVNTATRGNKTERKQAKITRNLERASHIAQEIIGDEATVTPLMKAEIFDFLSEEDEDEDFIDDIRDSVPRATGIAAELFGRSATLETVISVALRMPVVEEEDEEDEEELKLFVDNLRFSTQAVMHDCKKEDLNPAAVFLIFDTIA